MTVELLKKLAELGYVTDTAIIRECELKPELLKTINIYEYVSQIDLRNLNLMDEVVVDSVPVAEPEPEVAEPEPEPEIPEETKEPEPIVESEPEISEETKEPEPEPEIEVEDKKEEEKVAAEPEPKPVVEPEKVTPKAKTKKTVEKIEE